MGRAGGAPATEFGAAALVLRATPYGESDLVVHLLARGRGRLGAFARGARRSQRRFAGALEPFSLVQAQLAERRGADLLELRSASVVEPHLGLRADLGRLAHAGYAVELARELLHERQPADALLDLLCSMLARLCAAPPRSLRLRAFELGALGAAGLAPQLGECARCGRDPPRAPALFDAGVGGVVCAGCGGLEAAPVDAATLALLRALQAGGLEAADAARDEGLPLEGARHVLARFLSHHLPAAPRSLQFLRDVGAPL